MSPAKVTMMASSTTETRRVFFHCAIIALYMHGRGETEPKSMTHRFLKWIRIVVRIGR